MPPYAIKDVQCCVAICNIARKSNERITRGRNLGDGASRIRAGSPLMHLETPGAKADAYCSSKSPPIGWAGAWSSGRAAMEAVSRRFEGRRGTMARRPAPPLSSRPSAGEYRYSADPRFFGFPRWSSVSPIWRWSRYIRIGWKTLVSSAIDIAPPMTTIASGR